jgi:hypothetical protein
MLSVKKLVTAYMRLHKSFVSINTRDLGLLSRQEALHKQHILFSGLSKTQNKPTL